jgi:hypothetical protein
VGAPSFDNEFGSEEGRVSLYQLEGNSANFIFDFSGAQDGLRVGQVLSMSEAVHQYWPSVVRTLLMFIRLVNSWTGTEVLLILWSLNLTFEADFTDETLVPLSL